MTPTFGPFPPRVARVVDSVAWVLAEYRDTILDGRSYHEEVEADVLAEAATLVGAALRAHWAAAGYEMLDLDRDTFHRDTFPFPQGGVLGDTLVPSAGQALSLWDQVVADLDPDAIEDRIAGR